MIDLENIDLSDINTAEAIEDYKNLIISECAAHIRDMRERTRGAENSTKVILFKKDIDQINYIAAQLSDLQTLKEGQKKPWETEQQQQ